MPRLHIAQPSRGTAVGRQLGDANDCLSNSGDEWKVRRQCDNVGNTAVAEPARGGQRCLGHVVDVKPGLHWLLEPTPDGGYLLRPADAWFEFDRPVRNAPAESSRPAAQARRGKSLEQAMQEKYEQELSLERRWAEIWERHTDIVGGPFAGQAVSQKMLRSLDRAQVYPEEIQERVDKVKEQKLPVLSMLKAYEELEEQGVPDFESSMASEGGEITRLSAASRLKDVTGEQWEKSKKRQAMKRARKFGYAEELGVPDSASTLFQLKSENADGIWDFKEGEEYSDDDLSEDNDFDDKMKAPGEKKDNDTPILAEDQPHADEKKTMPQLTDEGTELMSLLRKADDESAAAAVEVDMEDVLSEGEDLAVRNLDLAACAREDPECCGDGDEL